MCAFDIWMTFVVSAAVANLNRKREIAVVTLNYY
jgi:hypothetical protein